MTTEIPEPEQHIYHGDGARYEFPSLASALERQQLVQAVDRDWLSLSEDETRPWLLQHDPLFQELIGWSFNRPTLCDVYAFDKETYVHALAPGSVRSSLRSLLLSERSKTRTQVELARTYYERMREFYTVGSGKWTTFRGILLTRGPARPSNLVCSVPNVRGELPQPMRDRLVHYTSSSLFAVERASIFQGHEAEVLSAHTEAWPEDKLGPNPFQPLRDWYANTPAGHRMVKVEILPAWGLIECELR